MKTLAVILLAGLASYLPSCAGPSPPSSNVARCDNELQAQESEIASMGGWLRCDPSYDPDEQSHCHGYCTLVVQWNRFWPDGSRNPWPYIWEQHANGYQLQLWAWELRYEVWAFTQGRIPDYYLNVAKAGVPPDIEQEAFQWATQRTG